jgi:hypothetical protein
VQEAPGAGPLNGVTIDCNMAHDPEEVERLRAEIERGNHRLLLEIVRHYWPYDFPLPKQATIRAEFHTPLTNHVRFIVTGFEVSPRQPSTTYQA